jgi:uncharacterized protein (TIGR00255 family)
MTGYGRGVAEHAGVRATVDVRAVNHRFLDIKLRGTGGTLSPAIEDAISTKIKHALERGAIAVSVNIERAVYLADTRINVEAAKRAGEMLVHLATELGLAKPDMALVLAQPGVTIDTNVEPGQDPTAVVAALDSALAQLDQMRTTEGIALGLELAQRLDELTTLRTQIATLAAGVPQLVSKRLHERVKRLLEPETTVDPARLAQEVALLADRADVTEELVRLASHVDQMKTLLAGASPAGRRLDFLVQEIGRELNTIGSKSTVAEISSAIVDAKAVLEKVREQVQNVE